MLYTAFSYFLLSFFPLVWSAVRRSIVIYEPSYNTGIHTIIIISITIILFDYNVMVIPPFSQIPHCHNTYYYKSTTFNTTTTERRQRPQHITHRCSMFYCFSLSPSLLVLYSASDAANFSKKLFEKCGISRREGETIV